MKALQQIIRGVMLISQLGFSIITPPLVLVWLAHLAQTRLGWGSWVMIAAILVGLVTAFCSAWRTVRPLLTADSHAKNPQNTGFNEHI